MVTHARSCTYAYACTGEGRGGEREGGGKEEGEEEEGDFNMATVRNAFSLFTTMVTHAHARTLAHVCVRGHTHYSCIVHVVCI